MPESELKLWGRLPDIALKERSLIEIQISDRHHEDDNKLKHFRTKNMFHALL